MSDLSSHDSSLDTTDSPSIDMETITSKHTLHPFPEDLKQETNANTTTHNLLFTPNGLNNYDDLLFNSNPMDFLMMDLTQQTSSNINNHTNINMTSPVLDFQNHLSANINITPSLNALTNGLFELNSNPNTPHLPPLNIDANSQQNTVNTVAVADEYPYPITTIPVIPTIPIPIIPTIANMPIINTDNIPPPTQDLDWQTFCTLINNDNIKNKNKKRKKTIIQIDDDDIDIDIDIHLTKKRKLNTKKEKILIKKKKRGRPRKNPKNPEKVSIKKEKKRKRNLSDDHMEMDYNEYLSSQYSTESYVGIRTKDGEVRIQIPPNPKSQNSNHSTVKFSVFGNACSDKIEDILQPKKRTRYVRGLSEEEKKTRRREQNRNAAARSRARKNAMISKVIQLHQENMGLRAFVAENITQTKILRDEINRLNSLVMLQQQQQQPTQSSLFDIINQDSSTLFQNK